MLRTRVGFALTALLVLGLALQFTTGGFGGGGFDWGQNTCRIVFSWDTSLISRVKGSYGLVLDAAVGGVPVVGTITGGVVPRAQPYDTGDLDYDGAAPVTAHMQQVPMRGAWMRIVIWVNGVPRLTCRTDPGVPEDHLHCVWP